MQAEEFKPKKVETYEVKTQCVNCGLDPGPTLTFPKGERAFNTRVSTKCPDCECYALKVRYDPKPT